ncbi:MAG TPA: FAD-binding protein [Candidatus Acetothermia bacterium]|nr:FAD-binding protein [Candidatus Acetothermia bacterium]
MGKAWDVVIVGGGPAGLSAAIYAPRAGLSALLVEESVPGGQLLEAPTIENYPGFTESIPGIELAGRMRAQAERLGAQLQAARATGLAQRGLEWALATSAGEVRARAVIVATGARPKELPAKGAKERVGHGISYCAVCDGYFFRGKDVLVVGAGDGGLTEALVLSHLCSKVYLAVRHPQSDRHAIRAKEGLRDQVLAQPNVEVLWNVVVDEIRGEGKVEEVVLQDLATGAVRSLPVDGVFVKIGWKPNTDWLRGALDLTEGGYVRTDSLMRTDRPGLFAAGDVRDPAGRRAQAVVAAAEGALAALSAEGYTRSL